MNFDAAIFDMDGVLTRTASVHAAAWKNMFDGYLRMRAQRDVESFQEFTTQDYLAFVDGRPRYEGVAAFLRSRAITIPYGEASDDAEAETVCGLGNRKNGYFNQALAGSGVEVYSSTIELVQKLGGKGVRLGVASSSNNCVRVLEKAGIANLFQSCVDGIVSAELGLRGKPEPDIFLQACKELQAAPQRSVVVEDAVSGTAAARKGKFGLIVGVAREDNAEELRASGADIVVSDLAEVSVSELDDWFRNSTRKASSIIELWRDQSYE